VLLKMSMAGDANDRSWFEPLARALERPAFQFTLMMTQDRAGAEEIVQEALVRVFASPNTPSSQPEFKRWLYRAITNLVRDRHRRQMVETKLRIFSRPPPHPEDEVIRRAEDRELVTAFRSLNLRERVAVYLHYYEDQPFAEIGRGMNLREETARVLVHRALRKLRAHLEGNPSVHEVTV
jgi:RNA polymerase sigma-70 factor (ECF subfamily)